MEKLTPKHNHTLTDILKVCIFAIFLMMPFFTMLPSMLYYGFNEHATGTTTITEGGWEITPKYQSNEVNSNDDLIEGNIYTLTLDGYIDANYDKRLKFYEILEMNINSITTTLESTSISAIENTPYLYFGTANTNLYTEVINNVAYGYSNITGTLIIKYKSYEETNYNYAQILSYTNYQEYEVEWTNETEVQKDIIQMIEINWNELWETNLYKWTNESILKQGLDNFTNVFGITDTSHITNLITYELIIVSIYIVLDIVLKMFTWLTHMIGNK